MLTISVIRAILPIMRTCRHKTESYNLDSSPSTKDSQNKYKVTYVPSLPKIVESLSPPKDMESAWKEIAENPDSTNDTSQKTPKNDDNISANKKLCSAINSSRR